MEMEKIIEETVSELLLRVGIPGKIKVKKSGGEQEIIICDIQSEESSFLIGQHGVNLDALQHIARIIFRKRIPEKVNFILDVNSYRQEKNDSVTMLARNLAQQCLVEKRAVVLRPMSPYERRLVHLELSQNNQVVTESIGEGEDRRVVIKPANLV